MNGTVQLLHDHRQHVAIRVKLEVTCVLAPSPKKSVGEVGRMGIGNARSRIVYRTLPALTTRCFDFGAGELQTLDVADLLFAQAADDCSELHLRDHSVHLHEKSLALERLLPVRFARVHRSFIADLSRARGLRTTSGKPFLVLDDDRLVPIGRSYRAAVRQRLGF